MCHCEVRSNREHCIAELHPCDCFVPRNDKLYYRIFIYSGALKKTYQ
jgi:hypothetical protein